MPFVTIAIWPVYFRKYQTKTITYVIVFVKYIMFLYVFFVAGYLSSLMNIISLTEFISFTFIGMIVNSSDVLPYCSVIIVVVGYIVYNTAQLYDEYHQLYQTVFQLGLEIDKDEQFPKRVVEHDRDGTLTIETDLFFENSRAIQTSFQILHNSCSNTISSNWRSCIHILESAKNHWDFK